MHGLGCPEQAVQRGAEVVREPFDALLVVLRADAEVIAGGVRDPAREHDLEMTGALRRLRRLELAPHPRARLDRVGADGVREDRRGEEGLRRGRLPGERQRHRGGRVGPGELAGCFPLGRDALLSRLCQHGLGQLEEHGPHAAVPVGVHGLPHR